MRLELKEVARTPGAKLDFAFPLDLSGFPWAGAPPVRAPVEVSGAVRNRAGALTLDARLSAQLFLTCDRCAKPFSRTHETQYQALLSEEAEDGEREDILPLDADGGLELDGLMTDVFVLSLDTKNLCTEDCRGLCPRCGADLNSGPCRCRREPDPRLAGLAKFLE